MRGQSQHSIHNNIEFPNRGLECNLFQVLFHWFTRRFEHLSEDAVSILSQNMRSIELSDTSGV